MNKITKYFGVQVMCGKHHQEGFTGTDLDELMLKAEDYMREAHVPYGSEYPVELQINIHNFYRIEKV